MLVAVCVRAGGEGVCRAGIPSGEGARKHFL